jgi:nucleoside-diphosphate-sugar epimerase
MRFRRTRLLIVGCGDVGLRAVAALPPRVRVLALSSSPERWPELRARGITPLAGNLDQPQGAGDPRTRALLRALRRAPARGPGPGSFHGAHAVRNAYMTHAVAHAETAAAPAAHATHAARTILVYGSTSGVYGDCAGALIDETREPAPQTARARRRVAAEQWLRAWGRSAVPEQWSPRVSILRIPGIYAPDRPGGTPRERLQAGTPTLRAEDDVYTSHIHADDLARACLTALWRGRPQRIYHASDDTRLKLGDYLDLAAERYGLPRAPRLTRAEAERQLTPERMSFLRESRQLDNRRLKQELRLALRYATVHAGLR